MDTMFEGAKAFFSKITDKLTADILLYVVLAAMALTAAIYIVCHVVASGKRIRGIWETGGKDAQAGLHASGLTAIYALLLAVLAVFAGAYYPADVFRFALYIGIGAAAAVVFRVVHDLVHRSCVKKYLAAARAYRRDEERRKKAEEGQASPNGFLPYRRAESHKLESNLHEIRPEHSENLSTSEERDEILADIGKVESLASVRPAPMTEAEVLDNLKEFVEGNEEESETCEEEEMTEEEMISEALSGEDFDFEDMDQEPAQEPEDEEEQAEESAGNAEETPQEEELEEDAAEEETSSETGEDESEISPEGSAEQAPIFEEEPEQISFVQDKQSKPAAFEKEINITGPTAEDREILGEIRRIKRESEQDPAPAAEVAPPVPKAVEKVSPAASELIDKAALAAANSDDSEDSMRTMQQVALLLQKEREKKKNKTPEEQRRMNEALADLLRAIGKKKD